MSKNPPKYFIRFFRWYCNPEYVEDIEGDLLERYDRRISQKGKSKADWSFCREVLFLFRPGIIRSLGSAQRLNHIGILKHHVKIAYRNLLRRKSTAFINIGGLVLGLLVTLMIGLWVQDELSWDKNNANYDQVVRVMQKRVFNEDLKVIRAVPLSLASELTEKYNDVFDHVVLSTFYWDVLINTGEDGVHGTGMIMQSKAPYVMSLKMINGTRDGLKEEAAILLSKSTANSLFGDRSPMNQTVRINDGQRMIVQGIFEDLPQTSSFYGIDFITRYDVAQQVNWESNNYQMFATIANHSSIEVINEKIKTAINDHLPDEQQNEKNEVFLHPMKDWHLRSSWKNGIQSGGGIVYVHWFSLIGLLVLFLACINFMNLSTAQSVQRAKEVGIRKSIGSIRRQLIAQFMTESTLLVFISFVIMTGLSFLVTPYFNHLTDKEVSVPLDSWQYWAYGSAVVIALGILAGSYPALYLSSFRPIQVLKGTYQSHLSAVFFRKSMVVFQFTISIILIIGTIVIVQQIDHTLNRPLGYDSENTISIAMTSPEHYSKNRVIEKELLNSGAVVQYAETYNPLTEVWRMNNDFEWIDKDPSYTPMFNTLYVTPNFGKTINWEIVKGRDFNPVLSSDSSAVVVNETAIQTMGMDNPVGTHIKWQGNTYKVVGIVKDLMSDSPFRKIGPSLYFMGGGDFSNYSLMRLNQRISKAEAVDKISEVYDKLLPNVPFEFEFVDDAHQRKFKSIRKVGSLSGIFSSFAIIISCLGLFGLVSFMVEQKTKEIGIRKVLGASLLTLWQLISKEFVGLVFLSSLVAIPIAIWFLRGWLEGYEYRVNLEWWVFATGSLSALVITVITTSFRSLNVIRLNPAKTLKDE